MREPERLPYGLVAIGRNEGERLKQCLTSPSRAVATVYVDSGSTDGSAEWARNCGIEVVELDKRRAFTAGRARNAGFARLTELAPGLKYLQFVDGDCELAREWPQHAIDFLQQHKEAGAVFGRRRERYPEHSVFNRMCDEEWNVPPGKVKSCGGDVMMRVEALVAAGGYREDFIAGEEPELCVRLRAAGWSIWRIDQEMTLHDSAMTRFRQWWKRNVRSGYAFALGYHVHGSPPECHWVWESRRAWIWGILLPALCIAAVIAFDLLGLLLLLIYPLQLLRRIPSQRGPWHDRIQFAFFEQLARFPEAVGQARFLADQLSGSQRRIIEHK